MGRSRKKDILIFTFILIFTIVGMIFAALLFINSFNNGEQKLFGYAEKSELDYKVKLLENDFYVDDYLSEEYDLVAKSIDKIEVDFKYFLSASDNFKGNLNRKIKAQIIAYQKGDTSKKKIWDYSEDLGTEKIAKYDDEVKQIVDSDNFVIDYQKYRLMMDNYKRNYGVSLVGELIVEISIDSNISYKYFKDDIKLNDKKLVLTIPLTEQIVNIRKNVVKDNMQTLIEKEDSSINYIKLSLSVMAFVVGLILCIFMGLTLVKLCGIDSAYTKKLKKIFRSYGSIIVEVKNILVDDDVNVMFVNKFEELLDAQQELRKPILYCNVKNNVESLFAIKYDNDVIVYKMKSELYNNKKKSGLNEKK